MKNIISKSKNNLLLILFFPLFFFSQVENQSNKQPLGIGILTDETTRTNRSYALLESLSDLKIKNTDSEIAIISDYPMNKANSFFIDGKISGNTFSGNIYKNGKLDKTISMDTNWNEISTEIIHYLESENIEILGTTSKVKEGTTIGFPNKDIIYLFPKSITIEVNNQEVVKDLQKFFNVRYQKNKFQNSDIIDIYGNYVQTNKNSIFFFKNPNVPENLKSSIEPIILPLFESVIIPIKYIDFGKSLENNKDFLGANQMYHSSLINSSKIHCSSTEKAVLRHLAFSNMSDLQLKISENRKGMTDIFNLCSILNNAYSNSEIGSDIYNNYYKELNQVATLCNEAEKKAKEVRSQKRIGGMMSLINLASSVATTNLSDTQAIKNLSQDAVNSYNQTAENANKISEAIREKFEGIETSIVAEKYISDGVEIEGNNPLLANEVVYFLTISPEIAKSYLFEFAKDKPKLLVMLQKFYSEKSDKKTLQNIANQCNKIEAIITNFEVRNIPISTKALAEF